MKLMEEVGSGSELWGFVELKPPGFPGVLQLALPLKTFLEAPSIFVFAVRDMQPEYAYCATDMLFLLSSLDYISAVIR